MLMLLLYTVTFLVILRGIVVTANCHQRAVKKDHDPITTKIEY